MTLVGFRKLEEIDGSRASDIEVVVAQGNDLVFFLLELKDGTR